MRLLIKCLQQEPLSSFLLSRWSEHHDEHNVIPDATWDAWNRHFRDNIDSELRSSNKRWVPEFIFVPLMIVALTFIFITKIPQLLSVNQNFKGGSDRSARCYEKDHCAKTKLLYSFFVIFVLQLFWCVMIISYLYHWRIATTIDIFCCTVL